MSAPKIQRNNEHKIKTPPRTAAELRRSLDPGIVAPEKRDLYRFPWSLNDNPQGWVEITDSCNITCKGCYRRRIEGHKPLEAIKEEILFLKRWRNIDNVTLAGGEPLIHPNIVEIVDFIHAQGLQAVSLTNGHRLDRPLLQELKRAGLTLLSFHIDSGQHRQGWTGKSEEELNELRQHFTDMLWEAGVKCNFNMTISLDNFDVIPMLLRWVLSNKGKVQGFTFIVLKGWSQEGPEWAVNGQEVRLREEDWPALALDPENYTLRSGDVYRSIKSHFPAYEASAYLGGTQDHTSLKWLVGMALCSEDRIIGSIGPSAMELAQTVPHLFTGRYTSSRPGKLGREVFLLAPCDAGIRRTLKTLLRHPRRLFNRFWGFSIAIIQPSECLADGSINMCEGCPDMTLFNGKLVHSCRLEEFRLYGNYLTHRKLEDAEKDAIQK